MSAAPVPPRTTMLPATAAGGKDLFGGALPLAPRVAAEPAAWRPGEWPFGSLRPRAYRRIIADPPWRFELYSEKGEGKSAQAHYDCLALADIMALPVRQLAHPEGCLLWLWATWPMLPQALAVLDAWGARYITGGPWWKKTRHGKTAVGPGYRLRTVSEPFLIASFGSVPRSPRAAPKGAIETVDGDELAIEAAVRGHSRKPDEQYALMETLRPAGPGAELFARQAWGGDWGAWGNQVGKYVAEGA